MVRQTFFIILGLSIGLLALTACISQPTTTQPVWPKFEFPDSLAYAFPFDLGQPDQQWTLPEQLQEVSGLSLNDSVGLVMVQDEKGRLYRFDFAADSVTGYTKFGKKGDYEAVERVGGLYYVLNSEGKLYAVTLVADSAQAEMMPTGLSADFDLEGMTYHAPSQSLWLVPKAAAIVAGKRNLRYRDVLAFQLDQRQLADSPVIHLDLAEVLSWMQQHPAGVEKSLAKFDPLSDNTFHPSGIAIHPQSGHIFLIASAGKLMVVLEPAHHRVVAVKRLPRTPFVQPEGICFDAVGNMYISNEGRDGLGTLLLFKEK